MERLRGRGAIGFYSLIRRGGGGLIIKGGMGVSTPITLVEGRIFGKGSTGFSQKIPEIVQ
jgi:hypothetical protein